MPDNAARVLLEVQAGLIPGQPEEQYTRRYGITADEWEGTAPEEQGLLLLERYAVAHAYALTLLDPSRVNWTRVDWIWL